MNKEKQKLEERIEEAIRILGNMQPEDADFNNYQHILKFQVEKYKKDYGTKYIPINNRD